MAIAKTPIRQTNERRATNFIKKAGAVDADDEPSENKKPTMIRIPPELIKRIDKGAKRLGISRSAFIVQSAAEKLERMAE